MKAIKINEKNIDLITVAINAAQFRAKVRTITAEDILEACEEFDRLMPYRAKASFEGCELICNPNAQTYPNAYKYRPDATFFHIRRDKQGYTLLNVYREYADIRGRDRWEFLLSDKAKDAIITACAEGKCKGFNMYA